jgi:ribose 1,5-bisphosphokinase
MVEASGTPNADQTGVFVAVVGPSGAGKDSLIDAARDRFARRNEMVFVRRVVTRSADAHEAHDSLSAEAFAAADLAGEFALSWEANGLSYGLPAHLVHDLARGSIVVANLSRDVLPDLRTRFRNSIVVHVTASVAVLQERLAKRGREDADSRDLRIARSLLRDDSVKADIRIENNGALQDATERFINILQALLPRHGH